MTARMTVSGVAADEMTGRDTATDRAAAYLRCRDSHAVAGDQELAWQDLALCAQADPEVFFPEKGGSTREAKGVCRICEVSAECLEYALEHDERFGIWGGMSERERRRLKRARQPGYGTDAVAASAVAPESAA